jgi:hypothetical protein
MKQGPKAYGSIDYIHRYYRGLLKDCRAVFICALVWAANGKPLAEHFHASSVIFFTDGIHKYYMEISHAAKGFRIVELVNVFPYQYLGQNLYKYNDQAYGGIICQGYTKENIRMEDVLYKVLDWWYLMDVVRGRDSFPASCTGLTETMLYNYMADFDKCTNVYGTDRERKLLDKPPYPLAYDTEKIGQAVQKIIMQNVVSDSDSDDDMDEL